MKYLIFIFIAYLIVLVLEIWSAIEVDKDNKKS